MIGDFVGRFRPNRFQKFRVRNRLEQKFSGLNFLVKTERLAELKALIPASFRSSGTKKLLPLLNNKTYPAILILRIQQLTFSSDISDVPDYLVNYVLSFGNGCRQDGHCLVANSPSVFSAKVRLLASSEQNGPYKFSLSFKDSKNANTRIVCSDTLFYFFHF